jgi:predicted DNA-binding transcriptional regulator AlpA
MSQPNTTGKKTWWRVPEVLGRYPFSRSTLFAKIRDGTFPAPGKFATGGKGKFNLAWHSDWLDSYDIEIAAARDQALAAEHVSTALTEPRDAEVRP